MTGAPVGQVPGLVIAAVLFAALMHASWNALLKSRGDLVTPAGPVFRLRTSFPSSRAR